ADERHALGSDAVFTRRYDDDYTVEESQTRDGVGMRWFYRYPNVTLQVLGSTICWMQILPQGPNRTLLASDYFCPAGADDTELKALCARLLDHDQRVCEMVQKNLEAGIFKRGHLSPNHETSLMWFKSKILAAHDHRSD
ncbi:MAG: SRPBCC family protein, partial [Acidimicrobiales bacterium]